MYFVIYEHMYVCKYMLVIKNIGVLKQIVRYY